MNKAVIEKKTFDFLASVEGSIVSSAQARGGGEVALEIAATGNNNGLKLWQIGSPHKPLEIDRGEAARLELELQRREKRATTGRNLRTWNRWFLLVVEERFGKIVAGYKRDDSGKPYFYCYPMPSIRQRPDYKVEK
ncbi:MAG: hypothetical protein AAFY72_15845 [Cyanobacteria bacterium J06649_4]